MTRSKLWSTLSPLLALILLLAACGQPAATLAPGGPASSGGRNAAGYVDITAEELATMLKAKDFILVNVHIPYEGEIESTDLFVPYDQIGEHLDLLPDKDARIVLYCRSGSMSTTAAEALAKLGYTNVMELDGGFRAWAAAGFELLQKP